MFSKSKSGLLTLSYVSAEWIFSGCNIKKVDAMDFDMKWVDNKQLKQSCKEFEGLDDEYWTTFMLTLGMIAAATVTVIDAVSVAVTDIITASQIAIVTTPKKQTEKKPHNNNNNNNIGNNNEFSLLSASIIWMWIDLFQSTKL